MNLFRGITYDALGGRYRVTVTKPGGVKHRLTRTNLEDSVEAKFRATGVTVEEAKEWAEALNRWIEKRT